MSGQDELIGRIYEAGALPDRWPATLETLAAAVGARGGNLIRSTGSSIRLISSPAIAELTEEFDRQGWNLQNSRVSRLIERASHPGFLTDLDLHSQDEIRSLPMYTEFLTPAGADAGAATVIQGGEDDGLVVALEAFPDHKAAHRAVPFLDALRPHLARAALLSTEARDAQAASLMHIFGAAGMAVAFLNDQGKVMAATDRFAASFEDILLDSAGRLRVVDAETDRRLVEALGRMREHRIGSSVAIRDKQKIGRAVLHLLPASGNARDIFSGDFSFALLARPDNRLIPGSDIIGALFDLTPAEARIARGIAEGASPADLSRKLAVSVETVRSQLKKVYAKTSTNRQSELAALMTRLC